LIGYFNFVKSGSPTDPNTSDPWGPGQNLALEVEFLKKELSHVQKVAFSLWRDGTPARPSTVNNAAGRVRFRAAEGQGPPQAGKPAVPTSSGGTAALYSTSPALAQPRVTTQWVLPFYNEPSPSNRNRSGAEPVRFELGVWGKPTQVK
jgi:hypothetical protein